MRLKDAARRFNDVVAYDAYTDEEVFRCAYTTFNDHSADGSTIRRRTMHLPEGTTIPTRGCIKLGDEVWIVGTGSPDFFGGSIARVAYSIKKSTDFARIGTPGQAILETTPTQLFLQKEFFNDNYDKNTKSDTNITWYVYLAESETVQTGMIIVTPTIKLRVRKDYMPAENLRIVECDELDSDAVQSVTFFQNDVYDPLLDTYTIITTPATVLAISYNQLYRLHTAADAKYEQGDKSVLVPKSVVTPVTGSQFTMFGTSWRVLTVQSELDCWLLHARVGASTLGQVRSVASASGTSTAVAYG